MISIQNTEMNMKISNILLKNIRDFQTSLERMVTGLKINKPADDPAGFFVASRFNTQIKGLENDEKRQKHKTNG